MTARAKGQRVANAMSLAEYREQVAAAMTEEQLAGRVHGLLREHGWRWCHFRPARTERGWRTAIEGDAGFPDIVAVRGGRLLFVELKSASGALTPEQSHWAQALTPPEDGSADEWSPVEYHLWRPADLAEIEEALR